MSFEYDYDLDVHLSTIKHMVKLNDNLHPKFLGCKAREGITKAVFSEALTPSEHDELNVIFSNFSYDSVLHKSLLGAQAIANHSVFGKWMTSYVSARNIQLEKTSAEMMAMASDLSNVMTFLQIGSIDLAYGILTQLETATLIPNDNYTAAELEEDKKLVESYLGLR